MYITWTRPIGDIYASQGTISDKPKAKMKKKIQEKDSSNLHQGRVESTDNPDGENRQPQVQTGNYNKKQNENYCSFMCTGRYGKKLSECG